MKLLDLLSLVKTKFFSTIVGFVAIIVFFHASSSPVFGAEYPSCSDDGFGISYQSAPPATITAGDTAQLSVKGFVSSKSYELSIRPYNWLGYTGPAINFGSVSGERTKSFTLGPPKTNTGGSYDILVKDEGDVWCELGEIEIESDNNCSVELEQAGFKNTFCLDVETGEVLVTIHNAVVEGQPANEDICIWDDNCGYDTQCAMASNGEAGPISYTMETSDVGKSCNFEVRTRENIQSAWSKVVLCETNFNLMQACDDEDRTQPTSDTTFSLCEQIPKDSEAFGRCARCIAGQNVEGSGTPAAPEVPKGIWTAVGCIQNDPQSIITVVIKVGMGVAGGVALLMILAASFTLSTSQGDAKKTAEGKEMVSSAVIGLIFIIMAITMLEFIGVKIFRIPGFGE